ncbi:DNA-directed DNA polymerase, family B, mitochondria/virus [Dillenia turbinata]|uniref:DNA polymerase n=1 Tax=Dillenia turbinata TaxID=194707 RepID=A0AAN8UUZ3_9MAGN
MEIKRVYLRIYTERKKDVKDRVKLTDEKEFIDKLSKILSETPDDTDKEDIDPPRRTRKIMNKKRSYPSTHITRVKQSSSVIRPFLVADTETILVDDVHYPYAAGLLKVMPGDDISSKLLYSIDTYFSEDYSIILDSFEERSRKVLFDLIERIYRIVEKDKNNYTIYFHNFSRFDGIFLLKHIACHHKEFKIKPTMRNGLLYELVVYRGRKVLFRFRDSFLLLPSKLEDLAINLCPELGTKGNVEHSEVRLCNLKSKKKELLDYMKQDILLLGGIMRKAQEICWNDYKVDIESKITLPSLALYIFRKNFYDPKTCPIHIPSQSEDTFIRRGYYGGHSDVYKPAGKNLYYYDVNSLYPFIMKTYPMPIGKPKCEEFKFAIDHGYKVTPLSGYLFEKKEYPFVSFVSSLFESRLKAKKSKNDALSFIYKILMNSLYGRFGINPESTVTDVCTQDKYHNYIRNTKWIFAEKLSDKYYVVSYLSGTESDHWNPPRNSAVQIAAAITACARIHMYPYIKREDCYYTDTDSVVLGQPLPEEWISSSVLGKFKLEDRILKGHRKDLFKKETMAGREGCGQRHDQRKLEIQERGFK